VDLIGFVANFIMLIFFLRSLHIGFWKRYNFVAVFIQLKELSQFKQLHKTDNVDSGRNTFVNDHNNNYYTVKKM
jgi:cytoskeletal protein RodZ